MNRIQTEMVNQLQKDILFFDGCRGSENYEYKKFEVSYSEYTNTVFLYTEVGMVQDEGTLAEFLCRTIRHIALGPKGGIHLLNGCRTDKKTGKKIRYQKRIKGYFKVLNTLT